MALAQENKKYTFADYLECKDDTHIEIMNGQLVMMAPPTRIHQKICGELFRQIANNLEGKKCEVYAAPFAVRLFEGQNESPEDVNNVVEPDVSIICDKNKLDEHGCKGAPDMVIEVLSPSTARRDKLEKLNLYEQAGVKEYWIVDTVEQSVQVFLLEDNRYRAIDYHSKEDIAKVNVLQGCFIELSKVFE